MRLPVAVFAIAVVLCVLAHAMILRSVLRSRAAARDASVPRPRLAVEILYALIPAAGLAVVFLATWRDIAGAGVGAP